MTGRAGMVLAEAGRDGARKGCFRIRIIRAGLSGNGAFYPDAVLREAAPKFEGARVFVKSDEEHIRLRGKDVRNLVGRISGAAFVAGNGTDSGELQGTLELIEPDGPVGRMLRKAVNRNMTDLFGLSIVAEGAPARGRLIGGKTARVVKRIDRVHSVDLIADPAAGGQVIDLIESEGKGSMKDKDILGADDIRRLVEASKLPAAAKKRLIAECEPLKTMTEANLSEAIHREADYLAEAAGGGTVQGLGDPRASLIEGRDEKVAQMLDAFFDPADSSVSSIRECYLTASIHVRSIKSVGFRARRGRGSAPM